MRRLQRINRNAMTLAPSTIPASPAENAVANATHESADTLKLLALRRSTKLAFLQEPGPTNAQLDALLRVAARAPDHGKLGPWRFVVIEGEGRARAGEALAKAISDDAGVTADRLVFERNRFSAIPTTVMVVSTAQPHVKIPEWEQTLSAGAVCYGLLIAAHAMGFAGCWLTDWMTYDARGRAALGLAEHERIAGFVYLGSTNEPALERVRADYGVRVSRL
jgi:nitroreductase